MALPNFPPPVPLTASAIERHAPERGPAVYVLGQALFPGTRISAEYFDRVDGDLHAALRAHIDAYEHFTVVPAQSPQHAYQMLCEMHHAWPATSRNHPTAPADWRCPVCNACSDLHLTRLHGWLKQHRPTALTEPQRFLLDFVFPGFTSADDHRADNPLVITAFAPRREVPDEFVIAGRRRRFAGDRSLPPGRYHVVATDAEGHDGGTLLDELSAYARGGKQPICHTVDLCFNEAAAIFKLEPQCALLLVFTAAEAELPAIKQALDAAAAQADAFDVDFPESGRRAIRIPYAVERCVIDNVVDLRLPETQAWFARAFGVDRRHVFLNLPDDRGDALTAELRRGHARHMALPTRFIDMLPAMLWPDIGGGTSPIQGIAIWMRRNGVAGLVFPSARTNCVVTIRNGKLTGFRGWNYVDYRGAPPPVVSGVLDVGDWPSALGPDVRIVYATNQEYLGSWRVEGYEEMQFAGRDQFVAQIRPEKIERPAASSEELVQSLTANIAKAVAGDEAARRFVLSAITGMRESGAPLLAGAVADVLAGKRDPAAIAGLSNLSASEKDLVRALIPPAPRAKLPAFQPGPVRASAASVPSERFQTGPDWFLFAPGGRELDIRCPRCGWVGVWSQGEEEAPERCPSCGFDTRPAAT